MLGTNCIGIVFSAVFVIIASSLVQPAAADVDVTFAKSGEHRFTRSERALIIKIAETTENEVRALLPGLRPQLTVEVVAGQSVIQETGELGASLAPGRVRWTVDASREGGVTAIANAYLRSTLFHEFHHQARGWMMSGGKPMQSFMDAVINEGMASVFARDFAGFNALWAQYPENIDEWVSELKALPIDAPYDDWMFQHPDGRKWIGYRAGAYLVDQAMKTSGKNSAELLDCSTPVILDMASMHKAGCIKP